MDQTVAPPSISLLPSPSPLLSRHLSLLRSAQPEPPPPPPPPLSPPRARGLRRTGRPRLVLTSPPSRRRASLSTLRGASSGEQAGPRASGPHSTALRGCVLVRIGLKVFAYAYLSRSLSSLPLAFSLEIHPDWWWLFLFCNAGIFVWLWLLTEFPWRCCVPKEPFDWLIYFSRINRPFCSWWFPSFDFDARSYSSLFSPFFFSKYKYASILGCSCIRF